MKRHTAGVLILGLALGGLSRAAADDWRQLRRDERRTAFSLDKIPAPLMELWSWEPGQKKSSRPFGAPAIWNGRLYTYSRENGRVSLVCVDARTGFRYWSQPLSLTAESAIARPDTGPAVVKTGVVFAYDTGRLAIPVGEQLRVMRSGATSESSPPRSTRPSVRVQSAFVTVLRAFSAVDGRPMSQHALPAGSPYRDANALIHRVWLWDGLRGSLYHPPGPVSHFRMDPPFSLGPPLVLGGDLIATTSKDLVVRWNPNAPAEFTRVAHRYDHPIIELVPPAEFMGFPPVVTPNGLLIGDDKVFRWLGTLTSPRSMGWHWDIPWAMGIPSVQGGNVFMGVAGNGAHLGLISMDAGKGEMRWRYPTSPLYPDPETGIREGAASPLANPTLDQTLLFSQGEAPSGSFNHNPDKLAPDLPDRWAPPQLQWHRLPAGDEERRMPSRIWQFELKQHLQRGDMRGHLHNVGVVLRAGKVYGIADGHLVCLDQESGRLIWRRRHPQFHPVSGLMASREDLVMVQGQGTLPTYPATIWVIDPDSGRLKWSAPIPSANGQTALAHGLMFITSMSTVTAFAPAERTFRMAVDTSRREDYDAEAGQEPDLFAAQGVSCQEDQEPEKPARPVDLPPLITDAKPPREVKAMGDASLMRLKWNRPLPELVAAVRARKALISDAPLTLVLDWCSPDRRSRISPTGKGEWGALDEAAFVRGCEALAAEGRPEYFEVGSDLNAFLSNRSNERDRVRKMIGAARAVIKKASPDTKVLVSFNAELLSNTYGSTSYKPFGDFQQQIMEVNKRNMELLSEIDAIGLTLHPNAGFVHPRLIDFDYLTTLRAWFPNHPVLVTHIAVRNHGEPGVELETQRLFLKRVLQTVYWLNARVVAYPEPDAAGPVDIALRLKDGPRPALAVWKDALRWKRVKELTAEKPVQAE